LAANIELCLPFNSGSTTDVSPTGRTSATRTGTVSNVSSSTVSSRLYGSSARFASGFINYGIVAAAAVNSSNNHTFEGWFRFDNIAATNIILAHYNYEDGWAEQGWMIRTITSRLGVRNSTSGVELTTKVLSSNTWYHFAVAFTGVACKVFIDGELQASTSNFGTPEVTSNRFLVGAVFYYGAVQAPVTGYFQDLRWYNFVKYTSNFNPPSASVNSSIAAGNDSLVDVPTSYGTDTGVGNEVRGNYATLNPLDKNNNVSLVNGNLEHVNGNATWYASRATFGLSSNSWYWEATLISGVFMSVGVATNSAGLVNYTGTAGVWGYTNDASKVVNGSSSSYGASYTTNDVIGIAFNATDGTLTAYKNGISQGQLASGLTTGPYFPWVITYQSTAAINFGQRAFAYTAPSGFKALCTQNLPAPLVTKPSTVFDVLLWSGDSTKPRTLSGLNFDVDLIWVKARSDSYNHWLQDSVRGFATGKKLRPNGTDAEGTGEALDIYGYVSGSSSTGFTIDGTGTTGQLGQSNLSGQTYVGWCWDAGTGSPVSNTQGSITGGSQVRANPTAGFSVVTWTGQTAAGSIGHGLGVAPSLIICKARSNPQSWGVYHKDVGINNYLLLDSTGASTAYSGIWGSSAPTSTVFNVPGNVGLNNNNGWTYVGYCFAPVVGYSSMGSYVGNGSSDGVFVYTGFRPRFLLCKKTSATGSWGIYDAARDAYNVESQYLIPNLSDAEYSFASVDFLSNGFKWRETAVGYNTSGATYIYFAVAESPFNYARAR
jgi:hypothetical protein